MYKPNSPFLNLQKNEQKIPQLLLGENVNTAQQAEESVSAFTEKEMRFSAGAHRGR